MHFFSFLFPISAQDLCAGETQTTVHTSAIGRFVASAVRKCTIIPRGGSEKEKEAVGGKKDLPQQHLANQWAVGQTRCVTSAQRWGGLVRRPRWPTAPKAHTPGRVGGWWAAAAYVQGAQSRHSFGPRAFINWASFLLHLSPWPDQHTSLVPRITLVPTGQSECKTRRAAGHKPDEQNNNK